MTGQDTPEEEDAVQMDHVRPRAVFSTEDFRLMRDVVGEALRGNAGDEKRSIKLSNLYHRLGRLG